MVSLDRLLTIIFQARALGRLQQHLEQLRKERGLTRRQLPITGTAARTADAVTDCIERGLISVDDIADFVDEVEDTGGQHVFLFDLAEGSGNLLSKDRIRGIFPPRPAARSEGLYAVHPDNRWFWYQSEEALVVKQVRTAEYWDRDVVERTEDRRVVVWQKVKRRAINSLRYRRNPGVQIRIDRVSSSNDSELAVTLLTEFLEGFAGSVVVGDELLPLQIWRGFQRMVLAKDETFMTVDEAQDPSVMQRISNRRERGTDVREHESYDLDRAMWRRKALNIYWRMPWDPEKLVHTVLSRVRTGGTDFGKVFVNAKVTPEELEHVLARIRHFTS